MFDGHFDGAPILPGVAHIALAIRACTEESGGPRPLSGLRDVRFTRPLAPGDEVEVLLREGEEADSVRFEIRSRDELASVGLLIFEARGPASDG